eukprot:291882-Prorocentrum_minimum.AAC.1
MGVEGARPTHIDGKTTVKDNHTGKWAKSPGELIVWCATSVTSGEVSILQAQEAETLTTKGLAQQVEETIPTEAHDIRPTVTASQTAQPSERSAHSPKDEKPKEKHATSATPVAQVSSLPCSSLATTLLVEKEENRRWTIEGLYATASEKCLSSFNLSLPVEPSSLASSPPTASQKPSDRSASEASTSSPIKLVPNSTRAIPKNQKECDLLHLEHQKEGYHQPHPMVEEYYNLRLAQYTQHLKNGRRSAPPGAGGLPNGVPRVAQQYLDSTQYKTSTTYFDQSETAARVAIWGSGATTSWGWIEKAGPRRVQCSAAVR